jgi:hypothetical protein
MGEILGQKMTNPWLSVGQTTEKSGAIMPCSLALANCLATILYCDGIRWYLRDKKRTIAL